MKTIKELDEIRQRAKLEVENRCTVSSSDTVIVVPMGDSGLTSGAREVLLAAQEEICKNKLVGIKLMQVGDKESNNDAPIVEVKLPSEKNATVYTKMTPQKMKEVISAHIIGGKAIKEYAKN